ncbi:MAG: hypothetical protein CMO44_11110 [Verrucomicrobiales bacterium]|nr:hypothetical protein [Verrucomicrobiales bacterium]
MCWASAPAPPGNPHVFCAGFDDIGNWPERRAEKVPRPPGAAAAPQNNFLKFFLQAWGARAGMGKLALWAGRQGVVQVRSAVCWVLSVVQQPYLA